MNPSNAETILILSEVIESLDIARSNPQEFLKLTDIMISKCQNHISFLQSLPNHRVRKSRSNKHP